MGTMPWRDASGRISPLKAAAFAALFLPLLWTAWLLSHGDLGLARPVHETLREIGRWTIRLLFAALAVTPLRWSLDWPRLILVRRMIGVAAFTYAVLHLTLYAADQTFDLSQVVTGIIQRGYLRLGFYALLTMAFLAATSTDGMVRNLGEPCWRFVQRGAYVAAALAVVHDFMQAPSDVDEPWVMAGLYGWLMGYRVVAAAFHLRHGLPVRGLAVLSVTAGLLTAFGEAFYYRIEIGADPARVLDAYLDVTMLRPGWIVLAIGLAVTLAAFVARRLGRKRSAAQPAALIPDGTN